MVFVAFFHVCTMHGFLPNLTATLLAVHSVLGCCWHHAHSCPREHHALEAVALPHCCENDHAHHSSTPKNHDDHGRHDCQEGTCVFLGPTKSSLENHALQTGALHVIYTTLTDSTAYWNVEQGRFFATDALLPRLRLHLICRVLLI